MVQVGDQASLWCRGEGLPTPTVQWYKNNEMVYPSANLLLQVLYIPTDSLHITLYTCVATMLEIEIRQLKLMCLLMSYKNVTCPVCRNEIVPYVYCIWKCQRNVEISCVRKYT